MLGYRTLEGQLFFVGVRKDFHPPMKLIQQPQFICGTQSNCAFVPTDSYCSRHSTLLFFMESIVGWISTLTYKTSTTCWPERFSVAYCMHIVQTELMLKNQRYSQKIMFTAREGPTNVPLVVLRYSVEVVGQQHATHNRQSTKNFLGTLK